MDPPAIYQPLDASDQEIRVLVLQPGPTGSDDILTGILVRTSLRTSSSDGNSARLAYETISYAWGDASLRATIRLDGNIVEVPQSSEAALRRTRNEDAPRNLWIDAICINQADAEERASQVAMMAEVYRHGTHNLVYLGEDDGFMDRALNSMRLLLNTELGEAIRDGRSILETLYDNSGRFLFSTMPISQDIDYPALEMLYTRPWFRRLWVLQEVRMARSNHCFCGRFDVRLMDILLVASWLEYKYYTLSSAALGKGVAAASSILRQMDTPHSRSSMPMFKNNLAQALYLGQYFETSDPLDKLFAVLGLLDMDQQARMRKIEVDYSRPLADVLTQAWCLASKECKWPFDILSVVKHRTNDDIHVEGLPSWVPRSFRPEDPTIDPLIMAHILDSSKGVMSAPEVLALGLDPKTCLSVQGFLLDDIVWVFHARRSADTTNWEKFLDNILHPVWHLVGTDLALEDPVAYIITSGRWYTGSSITERQIEAVRTLLRRTRDESYVPTYLEDLSEDADPVTKLMAECFQSIYEACHCRRVCETRRKLLVLGPQIARQGDIIVQLLGMRRPCVLRPCGEYFEFIGDCYVYGAMHGEAVEEWQAAGGIAETYILI